MVAPYAGITTTISGSVTTATGSAIPITGLNFTNSDIRIGDYLQVDDEIVRVKNTVAPGFILLLSIVAFLELRQQHTILVQ